MVTAKWILILISGMVSLAAFAEPPLYSGKAGDDKSGVLAYTVQDIGEPAAVPYRLSLTLRCPGKSFSAGGEVLKNEAICQFRTPEFNKETKVLTIHYSTTETLKGQSKCDTNWAQDFDLKLLCP